MMKGERHHTDGFGADRSSQVVQESLATHFSVIPLQGHYLLSIPGAFPNLPISSTSEVSLAASEKEATSLEINDTSTLLKWL